jgi:phosphotransferase system HPr (HPr) family protein
LKSEGNMATVETKVTLMTEDGLHARPAGILVKLASQFQAKVELSANGLTKNAKSIMSLMSMGLKGGEEILLKADGDDAAQAIEAITKLFESRFKD